MELTYFGKIDDVVAQELSKIVNVSWYVSNGTDSYKFLSDSIRVPGDADDERIKQILAERKSAVAKSAPHWPDVDMNENLVGQEI